MHPYAPGPSLCKAITGYNSILSSAFVLICPICFLNGSTITNTTFCVTNYWIKNSNKHRLHVQITFMYHLIKIGISIDIRLTDYNFKNEISCWRVFDKINVKMLTNFI